VRDTLSGGSDEGGALKRVTVVVPTYRSTEHLDALVASLDAQTLPQSEFEVLLIDDGSPDDTPSRLDAIARRRENYRVIRLPPSGWPSRPRNVGIDEAAGAYIVFVDHDDRLFPDALRAACALADRTGADVLDGKESKSDTPGWAMRDVDHDVDNAIGWVEPHPLLPMNPHKMFRTSFLRERGIRFPEGGRQIWEDIAFDIAAHARADVVSLLVQTPFYYWNRPEHATTSGTFHDDLDEYLDAVARVFRWIDDELDQPRFAELLPRFRAYQLHMRVLPLFRWERRTPAQRERIQGFTSALLAQVSDEADRHLDPWRRIKTAILRAGRFDLIDAHERTFPRLQCVPTAREVMWSGEGLRLRLNLDWRFDAEGTPTVRSDGARAWLALAPEVEDFAERMRLDTDVTQWLARVTYGVDRRSRVEKIDWLLGFGTGAELLAVDGAARLRAGITVQWPLVDDGPGRRHDGPWDLHVRTVAMRTRIVPAVQTSSPARRPAAVSGVIATIYRTRKGALAVDVGQTLFSIVDDAATIASWVPEGARRRLRIDLPHVEVLSGCMLEGRFVDAAGHDLGPCTLAVEAGRAHITGTVPAGVRTLLVALGTAPTRTRFRLGLRGRVTVVLPVDRAPGRSVRGVARRIWHALPPRLRRRVWLWRHRARS